MRSVAILLVFSFLHNAPMRCRASPTSSEEKTPLVIGGYLPEYRFYIDLEMAVSHLSDLILFSVEPRADGSIRDACCLDKSHFSRARKSRRDSESKHSPRLLVSVGGAGRSNSFPSLASTPESRARLIRELKNLCEREGLDGVDFDWERPRDSRERRYYARLLREAREGLSEKLLVTVALHPGDSLPSYEFVDRVHFMTYDMPHAPLEQVERAAREFWGAGVPREKIVLGIPAYGRHEGQPSLVKTYSEMVDAVGKDLEDRGEWEGYLFDSPQDVARKVQFARQEGLLGVFFWEIGQDSALIPGGVLLNAAAEAANYSLVLNQKASVPEL